MQREGKCYITHEVYLSHHIYVLVITLCLKMYKLNSYIFVYNYLSSYTLFSPYFEIDYSVKATHKLLQPINMNGLLP